MKRYSHIFYKSVHYFFKTLPNKYNIVLVENKEFNVLFSGFFSYYGTTKDANVNQNQATE